MISLLKRKIVTFCTRARNVRWLHTKAARTQLNKFHSTVNPISTKRPCTKMNVSGSCAFHMIGNVFKVLDFTKAFAFSCYSNQTSVFLKFSVLRRKLNGFQSVVNDRCPPHSGQSYFLM